MIYLAGLLGQLFTYLFVFFSSMLAKKVAVVVAMLTLWGGLFGGLMFLIKGAVQGLGVLVVPSIMEGFQYFLPHNLDDAIAILFATRFAVMVYQLDVGLVKMMVRA